MGCVMSQSESSEGSKCTRRLLKCRRRKSDVGGADERKRPPGLVFHDRCHTIIVPQLVCRPRGYYDGRIAATTSSDSSEEHLAAAAPFGPWKGHRFVGNYQQPSSPAVVSDSWSFAVGSPPTSLGSPVMFSEVWSKQGKRNDPPAVIDEAIEMEVEVEGGSPFVDGEEFASSPERGKGSDDVGVFRRRRKSGSVGGPMFMEAFIFE